MNLFLRCCLVGLLLVTSVVRAQVSWTQIPTSDPANDLLALIRAAQPTNSSLPENATYNYLWAENMIAWMVAERSGLMTHEECSQRLTGLLGRVVNWPTHHGFYFDAYNATTGVPTTGNVYFQGWWLWALILARAGYPEAAPLAETILSRLDYVAAGMVSADRRWLVADRYTSSDTMSFYIKPGEGDMAGEMRTAVIAYTYLTGDVTPWQITTGPAFKTVGGQTVLSVWHHFTFDMFFVHSCYPEVGYFQKSYSNFLTGGAAYRAANGMTFYATRMEALEAWNENPTEWPNTEHRVAKPWTTWLAEPDAPVMERAWVPGYGLTQYFDNWNFYWGTGTVSAVHAKVIGTAAGMQNGVFQMPITMETLPGSVTPTRPPKLTKIVLNVAPHATNPPSAPLLVKLNGSVIGQVNNTGGLTLTTPVTVTPSTPPTMQASNTLRLETSGTGAWQIGQMPQTYRSVQWLDATHTAADTTAAAVTIYVDGQRAARENPFAFICRAGGAYGNFPWKILAQQRPDEFGRGLVAWVGGYSTAVQYAHVIYNVSMSAVTPTYALATWETDKQWVVVDYANQNTTIPSTRTGNSLTWTQSGRKTVLIKEQ